jgi:hypothetical protein
MPCLADSTVDEKQAITTSTGEESESGIRVDGTRYEVYKANKLTPNLELALKHRIKYGLSPEISLSLAEALSQSDLPVTPHAIHTSTSLFGSPVLNRAYPLPPKDELLSPTSLANYPPGSLSTPLADRNPQPAPSQDKQKTETENLYPVYQQHRTFYHQE